MSSKKNTDPQNISNIRNRRKDVPSEDGLVNGILGGDPIALARAITLVESSLPEHLQKASSILEKCLDRKTDAIRIGITGVPGVGKSTFIETFGTTLTTMGKRVAVLAIDPTSSETKGSILGDKTRMTELAKDPNAFIRPSPSSQSLGGVARKTREALILCEAAGYDVILVETVGVGQSETAVHSMVDFFLLLKLAGAGDELQGIKRGIMEMADVLVINKADGHNVKAAKAAKTEFDRALHLFPPKQNGWVPKVLTCSALEQTGISEIWDLILEHTRSGKETGHFHSNRKNQNKSWLLQTIDEHLKQRFYADLKVQEMLEKMTKKVVENEISPFRAAEEVLKRYGKP